MLSNVRFWHKADVLVVLSNVRFWGDSGHRPILARCPLMTEALGIKSGPPSSQGGYNMSALIRGAKQRLAGTLTPDFTRSRTRLHFAVMHKSAALPHLM